MLLSSAEEALLLKIQWNSNMSNGGKLGINREREDTVDKRADSRDFGSAILRIAVAQICEIVGFEGFNESALDSFADIAQQLVCNDAENGLGDKESKRSFHTKTLLAGEKDVFPIARPTTMPLYWRHLLQQLKQ